LSPLLTRLPTPLASLAQRGAALVDYHGRPALRAASAGEPFNGQAGRRAIFEELERLVGFAVAIETGTFRGNTADYLAREKGLTLHSIEARERFHHYAKLRLAGIGRAHLELGDSRAFLRRLAGDPRVPKARAFFYLDAHWYADLPLAEEVAIVAAHWRESVIMVDDFHVPGDVGYRFDDYGGENRLDLAYLGGVEALGRLGLAAFFPTLPSAQETGARSGCVVLDSAALAARLAGATTLRPARAAA
jgi:hypothetical protein